MIKKIVTCQLSDNLAQLTFFKGLSPNDKASEIPLYIGFASEEIHFLNSKAMYESIQSLNLMKPKRYLDEWCQQRVDFPRPTNFPQMNHLNGVILWGMVAEKLVEKAKQYAALYQYQCVGLVVSLPDLIDPSLKTLIVNSFEHCNRKYQDITIKVITHSISLTTMILMDELRGMSKATVSTMDKMYKPHVLGVLDYSFNSTDMYVILVKDKTGIVIHKGHVDIGFSVVHEQLSYLAGITGKEVKPYDKWSKSELEFARSIKKDFTTFCNGNVQNVNFEKDGDTIRIDRDDAADCLHESNRQICEMVRKTIDEAMGMLKGMEEIEIDGEQVDTKSLKFEICLLSAETKNPFLNEMIDNEFNVVLQDGNNIAKYVLFAASYYTSILENKIVEDGEDDEKSNPILYEMNVSEIVQPHRFIIRDSYGKEILRFPEVATLSSEMIEIDNYKLDTDNEYHLIDTMNQQGYEYEVGKFHVTERGIHMITLQNIIGTMTSEIMSDDQNDCSFLKDMIWCEKGSEYLMDSEVTKQYIEYDDGFERHMEIMNNWNSRYLEALTVKNKSNTQKRKLVAIEALPQSDIQDQWRNIFYIYENDPKQIERECEQCANEGCQWTADKVNALADV